MQITKRQRLLKNVLALKMPLLESPKFLTSIAIARAVKDPEQVPVEMRQDVLNAAKLVKDVRSLMKRLKPKKKRVKVVQQTIEFNGTIQNCTEQLGGKKGRAVRKDAKRKGTKRRAQPKGTRGSGKSRPVSKRRKSGGGGKANVARKLSRKNEGSKSVRGGKKS